MRRPAGVRWRKAWGGIVVLLAAGTLAAAQGGPPAAGCAGGALGSAHNRSGTICEDFDRDRNGSGAFEWTRLYPAVSSCDPLRGVIDPTDDVIGHVVDGGATPAGVNGQICSDDAVFAAALLTCHPVPSENDWHLHTPFEGCDPTYDSTGAFSSSCAPEARAHSGVRSLHLGRHLNPTDTLYDTYRLRQTSAFVLDPVNVGGQTMLDFWQIMSVCDDRCINGGDGTTTAGGIVEISLLNGTTGLYQPWQKLTASANGYNSVDQGVIVICEFDPGDDVGNATNETMCGGLLQWSDIGDIYGTDITCATDTDGNDPVNKDCGETTNRTVDTSCSWVADPSCGSYLENGSVGRGVWARSEFDLSGFSGRKARLRWVFQGGGGWSFGESRSFLEPEPAHPPTDPFFAFDQDDGWYIDDIELTGLRKNLNASECD